MVSPLAPLGRGVGGEGAAETIPWEFYFGGMFGLLLGLVLRLMGAQSPDEVWHEGLRALVRSAVWFLAFASLEWVRWPPRSLTLAIGAGVLALLLHLLIAPGIGYPSLAIPLWTAVALGLNSVSIAPNPLLSPRRVILALTVPLAICVPIIYFLAILSPVTSSAGMISLAQAHGQLFLEDRAREPRAQQIKEPPLQFIRFRILELLNAAAREDPGNARVPVLQAQWYREMWRINPREKQWGVDGLECAAQALKLDPHGREPLLVEAQLRQEFARKLAPSVTTGIALGLAFPIWERSMPQERTAILKKTSEEAQTQYRLAAEAFTKLAALDPAAAGPHFLAAECWFRAGAMDRMLAEAEKASAVDEQVRWPGHRLTDPQREQVRRWLAVGRPR